MSNGLTIKFSHEYPKLHMQEFARLLRVLIVEIPNDVTDKLVEYDTKYDGGYYQLDKGAHLLLVFLGNRYIPFTTIRRYTPEKYAYYRYNLDKIFALVWKRRGINASVSAKKTNTPSKAIERSTTQEESGFEILLFGQRIF